MSNPASRIAAAVVVPTVCALRCHLRERGKARLSWAAASCGVPPKRTEMPGGVCWASSGERRRLATLPPLTRCTTVSGEISAGVPMGTSTLALLPEQKTFYPFYRGNTEKTTRLCKATSGEQRGGEAAGWELGPLHPKSSKLPPLFDEPGCS